MVHSLKEAFSYRGCPICLLLDEDEYDFMCHLQYQILKEEKVRQELVSSRGYCNFHFYEMARLTSPMVNSVLARELIDKEIKEIEEGCFPRPGNVHCPVCGHVSKMEEAHLREFGNLLRQEPVRREYERTEGLCRLHLQKIVGLLGEGELGPFLLLTQVKNLRNLREELQGYLDRGNSKSKAGTRERNAWWFAIQKIVGKRGLPANQEGRVTLGT